MLNIEKNNVFPGLVWKISERFLTQGVSIIISVVLARLLSPDDYGLVAMTLVFINLAETFVNHGLTTALIQKKDANEVDFSTVFYCNLAVSVGVYVILYVLAPLISAFYNDTSLTMIVRIFALKAPLSVLFSVQHAYVSRHMLFKRLFWSSFLAVLVSGTVGIVLAYTGFGVWALIAQYFVNVFINTLVLLVMVPWRPKRLFSKQAAQSLTNYGWKILAASLSGTFFSQLSNLLVGKYYSSASLAYYNKGHQFPQLLYGNIGGAIMAVLFPAMSNIADNKVRIKEYVRQAEKMICFVMFPLLFGMAAVAEPFILVLLGQKWSCCVPFLQIFCMCSVVDSIGIAPFEALKAIGRSDAVLKLEFVKKPMYIVLLVAALNIDTKTVALAMLLYNIYGVLMNSISAFKHIGYSVLEQTKDMAPPLLLSIVMAMVVMYVDFSFLNGVLELVGKIALGVVVYVFGATLFKLDAYRFLRALIIEKLRKS